MHARSLTEEKYFPYVTRHWVTYIVEKNIIWKRASTQRQQWKIYTKKPSYEAKKQIISRMEWRRRRRKLLYTRTWIHKVVAADDHHHRHHVRIVQSRHAHRKKPFFHAYSRVCRGDETQERRKFLSLFSWLESFWSSPPYINEYMHLTFILN